MTYQKILNGKACARNARRANLPDGRDAPSGLSRP
jgi:hypothetical protein